MVARTRQNQEARPRLAALHSQIIGRGIIGSGMTGAIRAHQVLRRRVPEVLATMVRRLVPEVLVRRLAPEILVTLARRLVPETCAALLLKCRARVTQRQARLRRQRRRRRRAPARLRS